MTVKKVFMVGLGILALVFATVLFTVPDVRDTLADIFGEGKIEAIDIPLTSHSSFTDTYQENISTINGSSSKPTYLFDVQEINREVLKNEDNEISLEVTLNFTRTEFGDFVVSNKKSVADSFTTQDKYLHKDYSKSIPSAETDKLVNDLKNPSVRVLKGELIEIYGLSTLDLDKNKEALVVAKVSFKTNVVWQNSGVTLKFGYGSTAWSLETTIGSAGSVVNVVAWSPDGVYLISGTSDNKFHVHNTSTWSAIFNITDATARIDAMEWKPDSSQFAVGGAETSVKIYNVTDWTLIANLTDAGSAVQGMDWDINDSLLCVSSTNTIHIYSTVTWELLQTLPSGTGIVRGCAFNYNSTWMVGNNENSNAYVYYTPTWTNTINLTDPASQIYSDGSFSPNGYYTIGSRDTNVYVYTVGNWSLHHTFTDATNFVLDASFSNDSEWIGATCEDTNLYVWNFSNLTLAVTLTEAESPLQNLDFNHNNSLVATGDSAVAGLVRIYNMPVVLPPQTSSVTLRDPANNTVFSYAYNINFGCNSSTSAGLSNITLGISNTTDLSYSNLIDLTGASSGNITNWTVSALASGSYTWNCLLMDTYNDEYWDANNRTFEIDSSSPSIIITYPTNDSLHIDNLVTLDNTTISINITFIDPNLDTCWYNNQTTNVTFTCGSNLTFYLPYGTYTTFIFSNDSVGNENKSSVTAEYIYNILKYIDNYNKTTYETKQEGFSINISYFPAHYTNILGYLIYNNSAYTGTKSGTGSNLTFNTLIDIPLAQELSAENNSLYWNFVLTNTTGDLTSSNLTTRNNQTVDPIFLRECNATYTVPALNFTFRDEELGIIINATANQTSIESTFDYWLGIGSVYRSYSFLNTTSPNSSYKFCIKPEHEIFNSDMEMEYSATSYDPRRYYLRNASLDNLTNEIDLNLLLSSESTTFYIEVKEGLSSFTFATVTISKYFTGEGVYKTVGIRETDEYGEFVEYLELDQKYQFSIVRNGISYGTITKTASCKEAPCELTLQVEEAVDNIWQGYYDVFAGSVSYNIDYDDTRKTVTFTFADLTGLAQYFRLVVNEIEMNQTGVVVCNTSLYTTSGSITCNITKQGYTEGDFKATGYVSRSPESVIDMLNFIVSTIKDVLGDTGIFVSLLLIVVIALVGVWNPTVGSILVVFAVLMMKILGFVAFGWTTVILVVIMGVIVAYHMKS